MLRRINSIGVLWNRPGDAWLGVREFKSEQRNMAFNDLLSEGRIVQINVNGMKHALYIAAENIELLKASAGSSINSNYARIIAPLDNLLWDRKLITELFGFKYKWEVYTPVPQREYGYYVLPLLCDGKFIARIEMETDKESNTLYIKNFWPEEGINVSEFRNKINSGINRFKKYNLCDKAVVCCNIPI